MLGHGITGDIGSTAREATRFVAPRAVSAAPTELEFGDARLPREVDGGEPRTERPQISPETMCLIEGHPLDYSCRVLRREVEGHERVLLLLGECHRKSEAAAKVGEAIIAEFSDIGCEGSISGPLPRLLDRWRARCEALVDRWWPGRALWDRGSSIDDAEMIAHLGRERINYATELMFEAERRGLQLEAIEEFPADVVLPVNGEAVPIREFPHRVFQFGSFVMRGDEIVALARSMAARVSTEGIFDVYEGERRTTKRTYHLEAGYQTGILEATPDLFRIGASTLISFGIAHSLIYGSGGPALYIGVAAVGSHMVGFGIQNLLPERMQDSVWYDRLTGVFHALNLRRDGVMTENIEKMFVQNPVCTKALCIVGAAHVGPIAARLVERGWTQEHAVYEPNLWTRLAARLA